MFYLVKLFPCSHAKQLESDSGFPENVCGNVFGFRDPGLRPADAAGTTCVERQSDGSVNGRHDTLHAEYQLQHRDGLSCRSVRSFYHHGECHGSPE